MEKECANEKWSKGRLIFNYFQPMMIILGAIILSIFAYYAIKLVGSFRAGILARGWKFVTIGATLLVLAQLPFFASWISSADEVSTLSVVGTALRFFGIIFLALGLRAQYQIWRLDNKGLASDRNSSEKAIKV